MIEGGEGVDGCVEGMGRDKRECGKFGREVGRVCSGDRLVCLRMWES